MGHVFQTGRLRQRKPMAVWRGRLCRDVLVAEEVELLRRWELVPMRGGLPSWPGDGTLLDLWRHCEADIVRTGTPEECARYREVHRALAGSGVVASDLTIARLYAISGTMNAEGLRERLGVAAIGAPAGLRAAKGLDRKEVPVAEARSFDDLLALFPAEVRERLRELFAAERLPPIVPPTARHVGRACALRGRPARLLAACRLVQASLDRRTPSTSYDNLARVERFDAMTGGVWQDDPEAVALTLQDYAEGRLLARDLPRVRARTAAKLAVDMASARRWAVEELGDGASEVVERLPIAAPSAAALALEQRRLIKRSKKQVRKRKVDQIVALVPRLFDLLVAAENRVAQLAAFADRFLATIEQAHADLAAGRQVRIDCASAVVRPDGRLGQGEQTVSFGVVREDELVLQASRRAPADPHVAALSRRVDADAMRAARIHLVYMGVQPSTSAGESHEPWFVDLLRCGAFRRPEGLSAGLGERRKRLLEAMGLSSGVTCPEGFLIPAGSGWSTVVACRRTDPHGRCLVVPAVELLHAMLYARVVLRMSVRAGARLAETRQLRSGCMRAEDVMGNPALIAMLKPKGWVDDGRFAIDKGTSRAIRQARDMVRGRWFPGCVDERGEPAVPVVPFGDYLRSDMPPARYVLRGPRGVLRPDDLMMFVKVLMAGIFDLRSHDGRYLFATAMGLLGHDYATTGTCLHHSPGSEHPAHYDLSRFVNALDATDSFNLRLEARTLGETLLA